MTPLLFPITYKCNLSCIFCKAKESRREPDLDICLNLIKKATNEWVWITGGEPLLLHNLEKCCNEIRKSGKKVGITTNGTILNDRIHLFADRVGVSIDGNKKYHDTYRDNSYDKAVEFLKSIVGKVESVLMFTKFKENTHLLDCVIDLGHNIGVDVLQVEKGIV